MIRLVGGYHLRKLWTHLQALHPDANGVVQFDFRRFKYTHDIADDAIAPE